MAKKLAEVEISHNDIGEKDRGTWRKFNPYNPYVEDKKEEKAQDLKIESLDDLFEDDEETKKEEPKKKEIKIEKSQILKKSKLKIKEFSNVEVPKSEIDNDNYSKNKSKKEDIEELNLEDFNDAPILPQEEQADEYDLQKELEAKFDELFGDTNGDGA